MSVIRSIKAILSAEVSGFTGPVNKAKKSIDDLGSSTEKLGSHSSKIGGLAKNFRDNRQEWDQLGSTATRAGAAIGIGLGFATKAAIDWESAWAGVTKTVDGTPEQMAEVEQSLRDLTRVLPATHEEIAAVAEAAGQLGVARDDLIGFTKVAIDLGETTNLSADEAATSLAQFSNVMGTALRDGVEGYSRLGATLVELGNNGASTEKDIMALAARLSGTGVVVGAAESDVLALANTMASLGIQSELGGGAMSRVMLEINSAVLEGKEGLEGFARVAGVSADEFAEKWKSDPIAAVSLFTDGLGRVTAAGGDAAGTLDDLGLAGTMNAQVLLRMAGAQGQLVKDLELGRKAWDDNNALVDEANKRYETTASKLQIAQNSMRDAAIDAGSVLGPMLASVAGWAASAADAFVKLPGPLQQSIVGLAGVGSAGLLLLGTGIKVIGWATDMNTALKKIEVSGPRAGKALSIASAAAKQAGIVFAALAVAGALVDKSMAEIKPNEFTRDLLNSEDAVAEFNSTLAQLAIESKSADSDIRSLGDALKYSLDPPAVGKIQNALGGLVSVFGWENTSDIKIAEQRLSDLDGVLSGLVSSGASAEAARLFSEMATEAARSGYSVEQLEQMLPGYTEALAAAELQGGSTAEAMAILTGETEELDEATQAATDALNEWLKEVGGADASFINLLGAYDAVIAKSQEVATASAEASDSTSDSWEDFYDGFSVSTEEYLTELEAQMEAQSEWERNMLMLSGRVSQGVLDELARLGPEGAPLVANLVDASDEELARLEAVYEQRSSTATDAFANTLIAAGPILAEIMATAGTEAADAAAAELAAGEKTIQQVIDQYDLDFEVDANTGQATRTIDKFVRIHNGRVITVNVVTVESQTGVSRSLRGGLTQADGGFLSKSHLGLVKAFASGGTIGSAMPQLRPYQGNPRGILWSEEGSGPWEAFISGHPAKRGRSKAIADQVVARLGGKIQWATAYANGGLRTSGAGIDYDRMAEALGPRSISETRETPVHIENLWAKDVSDGILQAEDRASYSRLKRP